MLRHRKLSPQDSLSETPSSDKPRRRSSTGFVIRASVLSCFVACVAVAFYFLFLSMPRCLRPLKASLLKHSSLFDEEYSRERLWGTYRSGHYLGMRMRRPSSLLTGLMWLDPADYNGIQRIRHQAQTEDVRFGWTMHNGKDFGIQYINDADMRAKIEILWAKRGQDWSVRVSLKEAASGGLAFFFYVTDEAGPNASLNWELTEEMIGTDGRLALKGRHDMIGDWSLGISASDLSRLGVFKLGLPVNVYHNLEDVLREALQQSIQMQFYLGEGSQSSVKMHLMDPPVWSAIGNQRPNFAVVQIVTEASSEFDLVFMAGQPTQSRFDALSGPRLSNVLQNRAKEFEAAFDRRILVGRKVNASTKTAMMHALSNLLGGIGYFHGTSLVRMREDPFKVEESFETALLTAVPSRTSFPRGFLWDEGFHLLVIRRWDSKLCADILAHWLDLLNDDGWMAREQILGEESRSRVPEEFIVQDPTIGNPPTLFLPLMEMAKDGDAASLSFLGRAWPRLVKWFSWLKKNHEGGRPGTFRWTSRRASPDRLNPLTLDSGLDDYPRASHPTEDEYHLDIRCWMVLAVNAMSTIGKALKQPSTEMEPYERLKAELTDIDRLKALHYDEKKGWFGDYGLHDDTLHTDASQQSTSRSPASNPEARRFRQISLRCPVGIERRTAGAWMDSTLRIRIPVSLLVEVVPFRSSSPRSSPAAH